MKRLLILAVISLVCTANLVAQECDLCGTWIYHYPGYYVDGEEICPKQDRYLRIDEKDGNWFVSIKYGNDGRFWGYSEGTQVELNSDNSLSFNEFYDNKVKHNNGTTSHCYATYRAWLEGRTLRVKRLNVSFWYDSNGNLYSKTVDNEKPDPVCVYHNERDNW